VPVRNARIRSCLYEIPIILVADVSSKTYALDVTCAHETRRTCRSSAART